MFQKNFHLQFIRPGTQYPRVTWAHVMLLVHLGYFNIEFWSRLTLMSLCLRYVIWSRTLVGSHASTPLKFLLSHTFRETWRTCRVLFNIVTSYFREMEEMLIEKVRQRTFLCDTKSPDCRDQHIRANAWEEIGKELKIKCKTWRELTWREDSVSPALRLLCIWILRSKTAMCRASATIFCLKTINT
jgi:hypothetical protein